MTTDEIKALTRRLRHYGDNDRDAACALIEQLGADLYKAEGQRDALAQKLSSANDCISDWVTFGSDVTEALGLRVMSPKDIKAEIQRLRAQVALTQALRIALEDLDAMESLGPTTEAVIDAAQKWYLAASAPAVQALARTLDEADMSHL
jgi:hypothetical protein